MLKIVQRLTFQLIKLQTWTALYNFSSSRHLLSKPCVENVCTHTAAQKLNNLSCSVKLCVQDLTGAVLGC
jgi:hypothetical protein